LHFGEFDYDDEEEWMPVELPDFDDTTICIRMNSTSAEIEEDGMTMYIFFSHYYCSGNEYVRGEIKFENDIEAMGMDVTADMYDPLFWWEELSDAPYWFYPENADAYWVKEYFDANHSAFWDMFNETDYDNMTNCDELVEVYIVWDELEQDLFMGETHIFYNRCEPWFNCTHLENGEYSNCSEDFYNAEWWAAVSMQELWYEYPEYLEFKTYWDEYHFGDWEDEWDEEYDDEEKWNPDNYWRPDVSDCLFHNETTVAWTEEVCYYDEQMMEEVCFEQQDGFVATAYECFCPDCELYVTVIDNEGNDHAPFMYDYDLWTDEISMDDTWMLPEFEDAQWLWAYFDEWHYTNDMNDTADCDELVEVYIVWDELEQDLFAGETHIFYNRCEPWFNCTHYENGEVSNCSEDFENAEWWAAVSAQELWYEYPEYLDFKMYWDDYHFGD